MARYIDADALLSRLPDALPYKASVKRVLMQAPEADVVPKSEVEHLEVMLEITQKAHDSLSELYRTDTDALIEARKKTEVEIAREIFEEIDVLVDDWKHSHIQSIQFIAELAELKKKYTEDTNNEN